MPSRIKYLPEYLLLYAFTRIIYILPFNFSVKIGRALGRLVYRLDKRHRGIALENIASTLELKGPEAEKIVLSVFENLGMVLAEFIKIPTIDKSFLDKRVVVEGFENYLKAKGEGKGGPDAGRPPWKLGVACCNPSPEDGRRRQRGLHEDKEPLC